MRTKVCAGRWAGLLLLSVAGLPSARGDQTSNTRSPHGDLKIPCENCHTFTGWKPLRSALEFDHNKTGFPLRGMHEGVSCTQCHVTLVFSNVGVKCADCHADIHRGQFGAECESCHTVAGWQVSVRSVGGHENRFPLIGAHAALMCEDCHKGAASGQFTGLSTDCVACHKQDFVQTTLPNHVIVRLPTTCEACHNMDSWSGASFDHGKFTGFLLTGAHVSLDCTACHVGGNFQAAGANCISCHQKDFNATTNPNHAQAGFPQDCGLCHNTSSWTSATFNHSQFTHFPLTGAHVNVPCMQCHLNGKFAGTPTDCASCHLADFQKTTNPNHVQAGFPQNCSVCHTTASWTAATFNHNITGFALTGAHVQVACASCHIGGNFDMKNATCVSCHLADFQKTNNPNHAQVGFSQDCSQCHSTVSWAAASFNHNTFTTFPLTGAHVNVPCVACHVNGKFAGTPTGCVSCHLADYQKTTNPNHAQAGFPQDCSVCHTTASWTAATFNHNITGFALTGAHVQVACASCHVGGNFNITNSTCVSCHLADYQKTTNPNHVAAGFPQQCQVCHNTTSWTSATFNHSATGFPLTGAHVQVACASCHVGGNFNITNSTCVSCHLADYQKTTNPNHVAAGFPQQCQVCHNTTSWTSATFNHSATGFPLTGAHTTVPCASCHVGGNFNITSTTCASCHLTDYKNTNNPSHAAAGFPQDCTICHNTASWTSATFNHSSTGFPLTGAHVTLACASCHVGGNFSLTNTACVSCHLADYQKTTNPNHVAAGFPQQCEVCHNTAAWTGATFNHSVTGFPLTGAHTTVPCASCHINGQFAGTPTDCYSCHKADYNGTTNPNHVAAGFPTTCQICHTTTSWLGATFNHTWFPIPHRGIQLCSDCHTNPTNYAVFSCTNCHTHNKTDTNQNHQGVQGYVYNSANCYQCHPTGNAGG